MKETWDCFFWTFWCAGLVEWFPWEGEPNLWIIATSATVGTALIQVLFK